MSRFSGKEANEFGWSNEESVACCFEAHPEKIPAWMKSIRRASREEDARGIDIVVETYDTEDIFIQVKSSRRGAKKFHQHNKDIPVLVVVDEDTDVTIRGKVLSILARERERYYPPKDFYED